MEIDMFKYGYTQNHGTPGPESKIIIIAPHSSKRTSTTNAIVDSGAVISCIPESILTDIDQNNLDYSIKNVQGPFGGIRERKTYFVSIRIGACLFDRIEVLSIEKHYAIIGRDLLNSYKVSLDPINKIWSVKNQCQ